MTSTESNQVATLSKQAIGDGWRCAIGDIVAVTFVDSGQIVEEVSAQEDFCIVRGMAWGRVHLCDEQQLTVIFQQFQTGNVRGALSIPWLAVENVAILAKGNEP